MCYLRTSWWTTGSKHPDSHLPSLSWILQTHCSFQLPGLSHFRSHLHSLETCKTEAYFFLISLGVSCWGISCPSIHMAGSMLLPVSKWVASLFLPPKISFIIPSWAQYFEKRCLSKNSIDQVIPNIEWLSRASTQVARGYTISTKSKGTWHWNLPIEPRLE